MRVHPFIVILFVALAAAAPGPVGSTDLGQVISADARLTLFARAVAGSGLTAALKKPGPYIVFVPSDKALTDEGSAFLLERVLLTEQNAGRLADLVRHHVAKADHHTLELAGDLEAQTLAQVSLHVTRVGTGTIVGGRAVVTDRLVADNGIAYVVDRLLWPLEPSWGTGAEFCAGIAF